MADDQQEPPPRWTEYMPLKKVKRALRNPKGHVRKSMSASMDESGYVEPMVLDERTGRLVGGHGRLDELETRADAGEDPPEGVMVDEGGVWFAPVSRGWRSRDDLHADATAVALNQITIAGGFHPEQLTTVLSEIDTAGMLDATGFSRSDLDDMLARFAPPPSLEELKRRHADPDPTAMWPVLRFKVNPRVKKRYDRLVHGLAGDDGDLFLQIVRWAEKGKKAE